MSGTLEALYVNKHTQYGKVGVNIIPIWHMRKLKYSDMVYRFYDRPQWSVPSGNLCPVLCFPLSVGWPGSWLNQQNMAKVMGSYFWWDVIMLHKIIIAILLAASPPCWLWWSKLPCWGDPRVKTYSYFSTQKDILETLLPSAKRLSKGSL